MHTNLFAKTRKLHNLQLPILFSKNSIMSDIHHRAMYMYSGVVGRERMGTAFPHKKLSGNGVPTREILGDIFLLLLPN